MDLQLDRYTDLVANAATMEHPPRIVVAAIDITAENDWIQEAGIELHGRLLEYHLYDDRLETCCCSPFDRLHYSVILGYSCGDVSIINDENDKWLSAIAGQESDYREDDEDRPWRFVEDGLQEGLPDSPTIPVNNAREVFVLWDFKDGSSDDPDFYNGTHQWSHLKDALENNETLAESLKSLIETTEEDVRANGHFTDMAGYFTKKEQQQ